MNLLFNYIYIYIYTVSYSHHRNFSYFCRIDDCVRHFDTWTQPESHRKDKHSPTEACPQCRYVAPQSRPYLMRNTWKEVTGFITMLSQTISGNHPMCLLLLCLPPFLHLCLPMCLHLLLTMAPSPDHGSRSKLTPVEITTKGHDLPTYVVEASGIFEHQGRL